MNAGATEDADGARDVLRAPHATDRATLKRVLTGLRGQMAGVDPLSRHERLGLPLDTMEHRTCTFLPALDARRHR